MAFQYCASLAQYGRHCVLVFFPCATCHSRLLHLSHFKSSVMVDDAPHVRLCLTASWALCRKLVSFMKQIAAGVVHIHSKGLVHRDIACRNILVHGDGSAKVRRCL